MARTVRRSMVALAIAGFVGATSSACSTAATTVECHASPAPASVSAPIESIASQLRRSPGVRSVGTTFDQSAGEGCDSQPGQASVAWASSIQIDMAKSATSSDVADLADLAGRETQGEVSLSIVMPAANELAKRVLTLSEGSDSGQHGPLGPIIAGAGLIAAVPHVQEVLVDPGLEPAVPGETTISVSQPSAVVPALTAAHKTILAFDDIGLSFGDRLQLTAQGGEPGDAVLRTLARIADTDPSARISNTVGRDAETIFIETPTKSMATEVAAQLADSELSTSDSSPKISFTIVASNPTGTVRGWVGSGSNH